ncbi:MAG: DUF4390 domain-containing protein [Gammaproteobacteria bacterium]|nr:DUF4390 domain-containing protein [Gammaproteobacteria bacterium]
MHPAALTVRLGWLLFALCLAGAARAGDAGFEVREVQTRLVDGVYRLDARVNLDFSRSVRRALESGVAIPLLYRFRILRPRDYLWDEQVAELNQRFRIEYHALSTRYVVVNVNAGTGQAYSTLADALQSIQTLTSFPLIDAELLPPGPRYVGTLEVLLDSEALPVPLRLQTWVNDAWRLDSRPFRWPLDP